MIRETVFRQSSPLPKRPASEKPPEPPPEDPRDNADVSSSGGGFPWGRALALGGLAVAGVALSGCTKQLPPEQIGQQVPTQTEEQDQAQALRFEVIPNAAGKVDVIRQTHTETDTHTDSEGHTETDTRTVDDPLQPVGVYLGHGLYLDAGLNLSLVPDRVVHGPIVPQDFREVQIQGPLGNWGRSTITQNGNTVSINQPLAFQNRIVRDSANSTTLELGTFAPFQRFNNIHITREGNKTTIQAWAPRGFERMARIEITQDGNVTTVHPFGLGTLSDTRITRDGNTITVQPWGGNWSKTVIRQGADGNMTVDHPGWANDRIQRGATGINFSQSGLGTVHSTILIDGNRYQVQEPGLGNKTTITVR